MVYRGPDPLSSEHSICGFDCGEKSLNDFLHRYALANHRSGSAKTFVALSEKQVVGYYSLAASQIEFDAASGRLKKGQARHPIPAALLARLAVDKDHQSKGLGSGMLKDAILRVLSSAEGLGIRALLVHAKDEAAKNFYLHYGFEPLPEHPLHLSLLLKDARKQLG